MNKQKKILFALIAVLTILAGGFFWYLRSGEPLKLSQVVVKDYQGKDLSSIDDFRENSIKGPQFIKKEDYKLKIGGLVNNNLSLAYDDIINNNQHFEKVVTLDCVEGWSVNIDWEGVLVKDLLRQANPQEKANTIIFKAVDGYSTSFGLDYIMNPDKNIIMAYKMNGQILPPERGFPFQLVAEDKWGYKWIKWITEIELSDNPDYRGYWESRGYSNDGSLDKPFLGK